MYTINPSRSETRVYFSVQYRGKLEATLRAYTRCINLVTI